MAFDWPFQGREETNRCCGFLLSLYLITSQLRIIWCLFFFIRILLQRRNLVDEVWRKQEAEGRKRWTRRPRHRKNYLSQNSVSSLCISSFSYFFSVTLQKASSDSDSDSGSASEKKVADSDSEDEKPRPALSGSESQSGSKSESESDPPPRKGPQARKKGASLVLLFYLLQFHLQS